MSGFTLALPNPAPLLSVTNKLVMGTKSELHSLLGLGCPSHCWQQDASQLQLPTHTQSLIAPQTKAAPTLPWTLLQGSLIPG